MRKCSQCQRPCGGRWGNRCYHCHPGGLKKSGEERVCDRCGSPFYVAAWQIRTVRRGGTYCSNECKYAQMRGRETRHGTRYVRKDGYVSVKIGCKKRELEHRAVMSAAIGRPLTTDEHVHHINQDRADNRLENLLLITNAEHQRLHNHAKMRRRRVTLTCSRCGNAYEKLPSRAAESRYCSNACRFAAIRKLGHQSY